MPGSAQNQSRHPKAIVYNVINLRMKMFKLHVIPDSYVFSDEETKIHRYSDLEEDMKLTLTFKYVQTTNK